MSTSKHPKEVALKSPAGLIAFGFGAGLSPVAPGTVGTIVAVPFYLLIAQLPMLVYLSMLPLLFYLGVVVSERTSQALGKNDFGGIVIDEMVGFWVAMIACPLEWAPIVLGFVLFRVFDIAKPQPIRWLDQKVKGGVGIMLDDLVAGILTLICLQVVLAIGWL